MVSRRRLLKNLHSCVPVAMSSIFGAVALTSQRKWAYFLLSNVRVTMSRSFVSSARVGGFSAEVFRAATNGRYVSIPRRELAKIIYQKIDGRCETIFGIA
jgi:hypothetical protein